MRCQGNATSFPGINQKVLRIFKLSQILDDQISGQYSCLGNELKCLYHRCAQPSNVLVIFRAVQLDEIQSKLFGGSVQKLYRLILKDSDNLNLTASPSGINSGDD